MRKHASMLLSLALLLCMAISLSAPVIAASGDTIVYVTETGTKYHSAGCSYLKASSIPASLSSAIAKGYTPCSKCSAPASVDAAPVTPPAVSAAPVTTGLFKDVPSNAWYADSVARAYELGLVKGTSATTFTPNGNVTIAETVAFACRLHSTFYNGNAAFQQGTPWYQVYVDYAIRNGIIYEGQFTDYNLKATRAQFASVLANSLPDSELESINNVTDIPDVPTYATYASAVYMLYNAGVLTGNDKYGTFAPYTNIQRNAVATIVARMADKSLRQSISLATPPTSTELNGEWKQTNSGSTTSWQAASINGNTITIYWVSDNGETKSLYWSGSVVIPMNDADPYTWISENNHEKTSGALLASSDDTKSFTYQNGELSYKASALGTTTTIKMHK